MNNSKGILSFLFTFIIWGFSNSFGQTQLENDEIYRVVSTLNRNISQVKAGSVEYVRSIKPFNSDETYSLRIKIQFNKYELNSDSIASYSICYNDTLVGILNDDKYYEVDVFNNTITIYGLDTINITSVKELVQSKGFKVLKSFIRAIDSPFIIYPGTTHNEIYRLADSSNNFRLYFTTIDSAFYDSTSVVISHDGKSLLKVESKIHDPEAADLQITTFDSIKVRLEAINIRNIRDSLINSTFAILEDNPYEIISDTIVADTIEYIPNWVCVDSSGKTFSMSDFTSRYLLLDFSYLGCYYCIESLPFLDSLNKNTDRELLSVCWLDPFDFKRKSYLYQFFNKKNIDFPIFFDENRVYSGSLGINLYPYSFLVELPSRKIIMRIIGHDIEKERLVSEFLSEKSLKK